MALAATIITVLFMACLSAVISLAIIAYFVSLFGKRIEDVDG